MCRPKVYNIVLETGITYLFTVKTIIMEAIREGLLIEALSLRQECLVFSNEGILAEFLEKIGARLFDSNVSQVRRISNKPEYLIGIGRRSKQYPLTIENLTDPELFALGHEIGHVLLWTTTIDVDYKEHLCDEFAYALLGLGVGGPIVDRGPLPYQLPMLYIDDDIISGDHA